MSIATSPRSSAQHFAFRRYAQRRRRTGRRRESQSRLDRDGDDFQISPRAPSKQAETQYYHSYENGACYEYVLGLGTAGFATEGGIEHVNRDEVFARLEKILATVRIEPKVGPVEPEHVAEPTTTSMGSGKQ